MNNNKPASFGDFLFRVGFWGSLGYLGGLRGSDLKNWTVWGPISEQLLDYHLEDIVAMAELERKKKERETALTESINRLSELDLSFPEINTTEPISSYLAIPSKKMPGYSRWREVIKHPAIVLVLGGRGSGKSAWMLYQCVGMSFWSRKNIALFIFPSLSQIVSFWFVLAHHEATAITQ